MTVVGNYIHLLTGETVASYLIPPPVTPLGPDNRVQLPNDTTPVEYVHSKTTLIGDIHFNPGYQPSISPSTWGTPSGSRDHHHDHGRYLEAWRFACSGDSLALTRVHNISLHQDLEPTIQISSIIRLSCEMRSSCGTPSARRLSYQGGQTCVFTRPGDHRLLVSFNPFSDDDNDASNIGTVSMLPTLIEFTPSTVIISSSFCPLSGVLAISHDSKTVHIYDLAVS